MYKKLIFIFLLLVSLICYFILQQSEKNVLKSSKTFSDLIDREQVEIQINENTLNVEVVNSPSSITQGLSGRESIGSAGMLFIFPNKAMRYFWMKDMKFDLDFIWIADNLVVDTTENVAKPEPDIPDYNLEVYSPNINVDMVLELNAGDAKKFSINSGDVVQLVQ